MSSPTLSEVVKSKAIDFLKQNPDGLHWSELLRRIKKVIEKDYKQFSDSAVAAALIRIYDKNPDDIFYKPTRGLWCLSEFRPKVSGPQITPIGKDKSRFYAPFADWLTHELEDVTRAITIGGNLFKDRWGTPDVVGKRESKHTDIVKGVTEIVSAEIKTDTREIITAFGQACAYLLFSHKSYLVVPRQTPDEEISRLDSLCQIFGIGLVTFDTASPETPDFRILTRAVRHEPDLFYTNKYMILIEKELFL